MTREQIQDEVVGLLGKHDFLACILATGLGKTLAAIKCIDTYIRDERFLWLVPETVLIKNAQEDFKKHGYEYLLEKGDFVCYQSLEKLSGNDYSVVVGDEYHWGTSEKRIEHLQNINFDKFLALSATIDDEIWERMEALGNFHRYSINLSEAIEMGIIPEPMVRITYLELDDSKLDYEFTYGKKRVKCTAKDYYRKLSDSISYWKQRFEDGETFAGNKMKSQGAERVRFLGKYKNDQAKEIINYFGKERFVCFCSSVEQAKYLGGEQAVSSQKSAKKNQQLIDEFNAGNTQSLFSCRLLQEGQNLRDTKYGLIIQLGNKERFVNQTLGRLLRHDSPEVHYIIIKNTVDERFLQNSTKSINKEYFS